MHTGFRRYLATPENRAAFTAVERVVAGLTRNDATAPTLLFLHGPSGCGKTALVTALECELADTGLKVGIVSANDFQADLTADLLIVEDLQHLLARHASALAALLDNRANAGTPTIVTALHGPSGLSHRGISMPARLVDRLASGLVVSINPMGAASRRTWLNMFAAQSKVSLAGEILDWLAARLNGGRELAGAVRQLKALQRLHKKPLTLNDVQLHLQHATEMPDLPRIVERVCRYFRVQPRKVVAALRARSVMLPRQMSMYLARQLTTLSLQKIGAYFGGRDHKTVQHACARMDAALRTDPHLSGVVRCLRAELT